MKNPLLTIFIILAIIPMFTVGQIFGIKAGLNLSTFHASENKRPVEYSISPGLLLAGIVDIPLSTTFSILSGLQFTQKGSNTDYSGLIIPDQSNPSLGTVVQITPSDELLGNYNYFYLEIPLLFKARFSIKNVPFYAAIGPYMGVGLFGKFKMKTYYKDELVYKETYDVKWGSGIYEHSRLDFGLTAELAIDISSWRIGTSYSYGVTDLLDNQSELYENSNRIFSVFLGYTFYKKN